MLMAVSVIVRAYQVQMGSNMVRKILGGEGNVNMRLESEESWHMVSAARDVQASFRAQYKIQKLDLRT